MTRDTIRIPAAVNAILLIKLANPLSCLLRGVSTSVIEDASLAVLPTSVSSPTANTSPTQVPSAIIVLL